jgi:hypothetical protein
MRKLIGVLFMNMALTACALAKSAVGDWQTVQEDIPRGWQITVETSFAFPCIFEQATNDELLCHSLERKPSTPQDLEIRVRRERIREIRVERREGANMLGGGLAGAGLGSGFGAILAGAGSRGASAYLFGLVGAKLGARSGSRVHILHGKVIYRRELQAGLAERAKPTSARSAP